VTSKPDYHSMLAVALAERALASKKAAVPIGAAIFNQTGNLIGAGHNRRVQQSDPSLHGEDRCVPKRRPAKKLPQANHGDDARTCWYCSGLVRQFGLEPW